MKKQIKLIFPALFAAALFALLSAQAAAADAAATNAPLSTTTNIKPTNAMTAMFPDPAIARGKGFEIKRSELAEMMIGLKSAYAAQGQVIPPARVPQIEGRLLEQLIQVQLLLQKASVADKANAVQKSELQISNLLVRVGSPEALERQIRASGMTMAELRFKMTQKSTADTVLMRELNVTATDAEATNFYNDHPAEFEQPEMVHVRYIMLMTIDPVTGTPLSADQQQAKRKQIDDILKRIRGGADFAALAKQYNEDLRSKENNNELTIVHSNLGITPEVEAAAFSLTNNQVSDVIASTTAYGIIKLLNKTPAKKIEYSTMGEKIKNYLIQLKTEKLAPAYLDKLQKDADVQILDADLKAEAAAATASAPAETTEK
jgi:parvulin-like peptidyl-prolyl isomerase